jgi:type IV pilus assembly protein PilX
VKKHKIPSISALRQKRQHGMALIFVLVMMTLVFSIAALSARIGTQGSRIAGAERDRQIALQGAEAALVDAESDITDPGLSSRSCSMSEGVGAPGCSADSSYRGICDIDPDNVDKPLYKLVNWDEDEDDQRRYANYGEFTNRASGFATGVQTSKGLSDVGKPASAPKYIIQRVKLAGSLMATDNNGVKRRLPADYADGTYLITSVGYGFSKRTQVMLQAVVIHPVKANRCTGKSLD